jgi:16S rRNA G966 N2-methylase RsmD
MKKLIEQLITASYTDKNMDFAKVQKIAGMLNRKMLKEYIKGLKRYEKKTTVFVDLPYDVQQSEKKGIDALFPEKKILYNTDQTLLAGVRITDDDILYELSLKDSIHKMLEGIEQNYD